MSNAVLAKDLAERRLPVVALGAVLAIFTVAALAISAGLQDRLNFVIRQPRHDGRYHRTHRNARIR